EDAVGQVAPLGEISVLLVGFPGGSHCKFSDAATVGRHVVVTGGFHAFLTSSGGSTDMVPIAGRRVGREQELAWIAWALTGAVRTHAGHERLRHSRTSVDSRSAGACDERRDQPL